MTSRLGIIGGSGLHDLDNLTNVRSTELETPFGKPSGPLITGTLHGLEICFLPRHGQGHTLNPSEVPYRANIWALKHAGVTHALSVSAVGSLTERYPPLTLVCPDQIIDRTTGRDRTFFDEGIVAHVGLAAPFCAAFSDLIVERAAAFGVPISQGGAYVCIEGPQFSTRAESALYRSWDASIIGMTAMPEARLAREAELCYAQIAMVTDFDVWHESEIPVTVDMVIANVHENTAKVKHVLRAICSPGALSECSCGCTTALSSAIVTPPTSISASTRDRVSLLIGHYVS
jgi:5'-methylthioadenosine phosphorylase